MGVANLACGLLTVSEEKTDVMKLNGFLHAGTNTHKLKGKIARQELKKLFEFATSGTHFCFVGNYYDQIDRTAMGSPLGPVLANLFIGFHEKRMVRSVSILWCFTLPLVRW